MSIIACPECGEKISDKAKNCIHCGCKITVCPECGNVSAEEIETCSVCGYAMSQKKIEEVKDKNENLKDVKSLNGAFCKSMPIVSLFSTKAANIISLILLGAVLVFAGFGVGGFFIWLGNGNFLKGAETVNNTNTLLILATICLIIVSAYGACAEYVYTLFYSKYLDAKKIDSISAIQEALNVDFDKLTLDSAGELSSAIRETIWATVIQKSAVYKSQKTKNTVVGIVLFGMFAILLCSFLVDVVNVWGGAVILLGKDNFSFSMIENWWLLIGAGIVLVVGFIWDKIAEKIETNSIDACVKKNIPDNYKQYESKVKNFDDYIVDKIGEIEGD